jgi:gliding motility-associated-like protein
MVTASLMISASANNICAGIPVTFTATSTNGGSSPAYQWLLNGSNAGTNSATFSSSTLANGDVVNCVINSSSACVISASVTSNSIIMNVNANAVPSVSITASQNTVCAGAAVTFTATAINGGSAPVYQWLVNGVNAGTNSATFSGSNFADGDRVSCVITSNAGCATPAIATSNSITMMVSPLLSPAISITSSQNNICPGTNVTFTATPTNGGISPTYQWLVNGVNTGANSPTFASGVLSNGDIISCKLTSNAACLTIPGATSNDIIMAVNSQTVPSVSISISANNVCAGTPLTFTATPSNGGNSPVYQWLLNGKNSGTNSTIFSGTFNNGDVVSCIMTSGMACSTPANIASNSIIANIFPSPAVNGGGNKTVERGGSIALKATTSGDIADVTWSPVTGLDNNKILNPQANPTVTTLYTITVQTAQGCVAFDSVMITVYNGITIPNTFTPNGDGINDVWNIKSLDAFPECLVSVFDRYGSLVYQSRGYSTPWDGTRNGQKLPVGTYYYLINTQTAGMEPFAGPITILR